MLGVHDGWLAVAAVVLAAGGCGGETSGGPGTSGGGAAASGGAAGESGGGGTSGGGPVPSLCTLPPESGSCDAYFPSFYHDASIGLCTPFIYGGCGGNDNRFATVAECQAACDGGSPNLDACAAHAECAIGYPGCCGACDPVRDEDLVALNAERLDEYAAIRSCGNVACEPCLAPSPSERTRPYYVATCERGGCQPLDVRTTPATACTSDADCSLRVGSDCCWSCDPMEVVAISDEDALRALVCDDPPPPCPRCAAQIPPNLVAVCDAGRCAVRELGP